MTENWAGPARAMVERLLIDAGPDGLSGLWSLAKAAQRATLRLALDPAADPDLSMTHAAMDLGELLEEIEWAHPDARARAVAVDLGDPPADPAGCRDVIAALLVGALEVAAAVLRAPAGESTTAEILMLARHGRTNRRLRTPRRRTALVCCQRSGQTRRMTASDAGSSDVIPERLLGFLAFRGFVRSPEVAVTTTLAWLSGRRHVADALRVLTASSGLQLGQDAQWRAEVMAKDTTRTDLECWDGDPSAPVVVIEAKLGAELTSDQLRGYAADQSRRLTAVGGRRGLLVALVPAHRRDEAEARMAEAVSETAEADHQALDESALRSAVWTFDELLAAIEGSENGDADVAQLRALIDAVQAIDIRPFTRDDLTRPTAARQRDLQLIADRVSAEVSPAGSRLLPGGQDADFWWRRYVVPRPDDTNLAIGVRKRHDSDTAAWPSPLWLRVHRDTPNALSASDHLRCAFATAETDSNGHTWVPFHVTTGVGGASVVNELTQQAREFARMALQQRSRSG